MLNADVLGRLKGLAEQVSAREGCRLYDLEFVGRGSQRILRVFIDSPDSSVTVDQCANVSRGLSLLLDVEDLVPGGTYDLEVSSPGLERPLTETWHFEQAVGERVRVRTNAPIPQPADMERPPKKPVKQLIGELLSAGEEELKVKTDDGTEWSVHRNIIHKANVVFEFQKSEKQVGKNGRKR